MLTDTELEKLTRVSKRKKTPVAALAYARLARGLGTLR